MKKLTIKQENFCQEYINTGNASEAYRRSYDVSKMKTESIHRKATELMSNVNVSARISELQKEFAQKKEIDREYILDEYLQLLKSCKEEGIDGQGTLKDRTNWAKALAQVTKMLGLDAPITINHNVFNAEFGVNIENKEDEED
jgi:phage terminase small subunit